MRTVESSSSSSLHGVTYTSGRSGLPPSLFASPQPSSGGVVTSSESSDIGDSRSLSRGGGLRGDSMLPWGSSSEASYA